MFGIDLFHGTISHHKASFERTGISLKKAKAKADFGRGFYVSNTNSFAAETAKNRARKTNNKNMNDAEQPLVIKVVYDEELRERFHLSYYHFEDVCEEWLRFVIYNRVRPEIKKEIRKRYTFKEYDIVSGPIADTEVTTLVSEIDEGIIGWEEVKLEHILPYKNGKDVQYVFRTPEAISCLTINSYKIIDSERE